MPYEIIAPTIKLILTLGIIVIGFFWVVKLDKLERRLDNYTRNDSTMVDTIPVIPSNAYIAE